MDEKAKRINGASGEDQHAPSQLDVSAGSTHEGQLVLPQAGALRGTLLVEIERVARLRAAIPQILAAVEGETDEVALEATLACLLWETLIQTNWCGFYRRVQDRLLKVGPYQGQMGCLSISFDKGVCGTSARTESTVMVPDVHQFPGHIACDSKTKSELVLPVKNGSGRLIAVLDLDSMSLDGFCAQEAKLLEELLERVFKQVI